VRKRSLNFFVYIYMFHLKQLLIYFGQMQRTNLALEVVYGSFLSPLWKHVEIPYSLARTISSKIFLTISTHAESVI
jgi:hypothetical protein